MTSPACLEGVPHAEPPDKDALRDIVQGLDKRQSARILRAALRSHFESEMLKPYQPELIKMQAHLERQGKKAIVLFDGRDASGKGGTIRRVTRYMNEKHYRVVALGKPSRRQQTELHMKRYIEQLPPRARSCSFTGPGTTARWSSRSWASAPPSNTASS